MTRAVHGAPLALNPFYVYIGVFGLVLAAYQLGWSTMYPPLSSAMWTFLTASFICAAVLGASVAPQLRAMVRSPGRAPAIGRAWIILLMLSYAAEIAYARTIPLLAVVAGDAFFYDEFGIPSLHVYTMTFGASFSVMQFHRVLRCAPGRERRAALALALAPLAYDLAIVSRGYIVVTMTAWLATYVLSRRITWRHIGGMAGVVAVLLMGFAALGDLRTASRTEQEFVENVILDIGEASDSFRESGTPPGLFWGYVYATSPLSNFQTTVDRAPVRSGPENVIGFVMAELLPDFVSKRILAGIGEQKQQPILVKDALNVATVYAEAYVYLQWWGPAIMFAALSALMAIYIVLLKHNRFAVPSLALLNTFIAFCIFDNMIYYSGMSLQLLWPLLFSLRVMRRDASRALPAVVTA